MFFEFINIFVIFQSYINEALKLYIDIYYIVYLNNVFIYFDLKKQHYKNVRKMLKTLLKHRLYIKLKKCVFNHQKINFLKFVIERHEI